jgi:hypothetical protein
MLYARVSITLTFSGQKREFIGPLITSLTNLEHFYVNWNEKKLTKIWERRKNFRETSIQKQKGVARGRDIDDLGGWNLRFKELVLEEYEWLEYGIGARMKAKIQSKSPLSNHHRLEPKNLAHSPTPRVFTYRTLIWRRVENSRGIIFRAMIKYERNDLF